MEKLGTINDRYKRKHKKFYSEEENRVKHRERLRRNTADLKERVIFHYSKGKEICANCNFSNLDALTIDHIEEETQPKVRGAAFYRQLIREGFPKGYQVLCFNCNRIKHINYKRIKNNYVQL